ncbi:MAG: Scr1 family TA system antitoxin-like transcriptional regulator [Pseudonocardiaceae bacterium]
MIPTEVGLKLARYTKQRGWWHSYSQVMPEWFEAYLRFEAEACRISNFEPQIMPGLLQTEEYAAAVLGAHPLRTTPDEPDRWTSRRP